MSDLPEGWAEASLGELGEYINGRGFKKSEWDTEGLPIIRIQNLTGTSSDYNYFSGTVDDRYRVNPGDLLVSWAATIGAYIWSGETEGWLNQHIFKVVSRIDESFHFYLLQSVLDDLRRKTHGGGMIHITRGRFDDTETPIPPLTEQRRIVAKIEELFSELDAGTHALERAQVKLGRYRASVLKAAVEGKLTEQWRRENPPEETGQELLERILVERRKRWEEEQLATYEAKGKKPPKNWRERYEEPLGADVEELPELPEGWCWATVDQVSREVQYGTSAKTSAEAPDGVPVLRMGNIKDGELDLADLKYLDAGHEDFPKLLLDQGDFLFNRTNSAELVGKSAMYEGTPAPCSFASYLIRAQLLGGCCPKMLVFWMNSPLGRSWTRTVVSQQVGQANINGTKLRAFAFPLPPWVEQVKIIAQVDERFDQAARVVRDVAYTVGGGQALRRAILKRAFEGRLVPQDPDDEPASVLLDRIRAQREAAKPKKKRGRKESPSQLQTDA